MSIKYVFERKKTIELVGRGEKIVHNMFKFDLRTCGSVFSFGSAGAANRWPMHFSRVHNFFQKHAADINIIIH